MFNELENLSENGQKMPVLFVGHGNPMNAVEENDFTLGWRKSVGNIPKPKAVLVVSAHWETRGTLVTAMEKPRTIHDFYGFPQNLFDVQYPAPGSFETARLIVENAPENSVGFNETWGLDHGAWSVLVHIFPEADVPVLQLSLNINHSPREHFEFAKKLAFLRERGVLIIGSGNMVHNLGLIKFREKGGDDWAIEANEIFKKMISSGRYDDLINYERLGSEAVLAVPTAEHFLPLLYALALHKKDEKLEFFNDAVELGSISMTSLKIG